MTVCLCKHIEALPAQTISPAQLCAGAAAVVSAHLSRGAGGWQTVKEENFYSALNVCFGLVDLSVGQ